jgi:hypothetical protein
MTTSSSDPYAYGAAMPAAIRAWLAVLATGAVALLAAGCANPRESSTTTSRPAQQASPGTAVGKPNGVGARDAVIPGPGPGAQPVSVRAMAALVRDFDAGYLAGKAHDLRSPAEKSAGGRDPDDAAILAGFGHGASPAEARPIIVAAKRYYAAAKANRARAACSLVAPSSARLMAAEFGRFGFPYAHHAKTCRETLSLIFGHLVHRLSAPVVALNVIVRGDSAHVLIASRTMPTALLSMQRWHGAWTITEPIAGDMW